MQISAYLRTFYRHGYEHLYEHLCNHLYEHMLRHEAWQKDLLRTPKDDCEGVFVKVLVKVLFVKVFAKARGAR